MESHALLQVFHRLDEALADYRLFLLIVSRDDLPDGLESFVREDRRLRRNPVLPLTMAGSPSLILDVLDPSPVLTEVAKHPERWPGVLMWTRRGDKLFLPYNHGGDLEALFKDALYREYTSEEDFIDYLKIHWQKSFCTNVRKALRYCT